MFLDFTHSSLLHSLYSEVRIQRIADCSSRPTCFKSINIATGWWWQINAVYLAEEACVVIRTPCNIRLILPRRKLSSVDRLDAEGKGI